MTPGGEKLDRFLREAIKNLSPPPKQRDEAMRGIQRLANASSALLQQADAAADAAAEKLEKAYAKHMNVARSYEEFADEVSKKADEALDQLNQISNAPPTSSGSQS